MQVNNYTVVARHNRPNISQRIGLRTFFINDGAYVDPYSISAVQLFSEAQTLSPSTVLGPDNLVSATPLMTYGASDAILTSSVKFNVSNYTPSITASGIYRIKEGEYVVVLDETLNLSGWDANRGVVTAASSLSSVGNYVDLWTVQLNEASKYQVITNKFSLHEDTFFAFTQPLLLTTSNKLLNKHVRFGEVVDLKISTEVSLENKDIDQSIQNIFKESFATNATVTIKKVNYDPPFDGPFEVVGPNTTAGTMSITSDNTLIYSWDTATSIAAGAAVGNFGSLTGTYSVQVTYNVLTQTIISPLFYLTVS